MVVRLKPLNQGIRVLLLPKTTMMCENQANSALKPDFKTSSKIQSKLALWWLVIMYLTSKI